MHSSSQRMRPSLVAIVGGSGAGKTWLAEKLMRVFAPHATLLSEDDFYRDRSHLSSARRARLNFDHPRAIDWLSLEKAVASLRAGRPARVPLYDFATHSRKKGCKIIEPKPLILVEGLWLLRRRSLRQAFQWSIFIDCPMRMRLSRRVERDLACRGRSLASVRAQFHGTVERMHRHYVTPQRRVATMILSGIIDPPAVARLASAIRAGICPN